MTLEEMKCKPPSAGDPPLSPREAEALLLRDPGMDVGRRRTDPRSGLHRFRRDDGIRQPRRRPGRKGKPSSLHPYRLIARCGFTLRTHKINGLSLNDFILAAKVNRLIDPPDSGVKGG